MAKVSVIIPARNERFLQATIDDLLAKAGGEVEIIAVLDGYWPDPPLKEDPRVIVVHRTEAQGMRPAINSAAAIASGTYLMKCDAHCIFAPGYDVALQAACDDNWLVVPTRHSIDPATWTMKPRAWNYHYLTFPYDLSMYGYGLHAKTLDWPRNKVYNERKKHILIDDLMSFQGSCWFQTRANFERLGPLDHQNYYFYQEAQEVGLRQWMTGGRCVINKTTWYAHLHKGREEGRGFYLSLKRKRDSEAFATDFWLHDRWPGATRTFVSFIEQFELLLQELTGQDRWPDDWRDVAKYRRQFETRPAEQIPAHT